MPLDAWHQPYDQMAVKKMEILGKIQAGWGRWRRVSGVACDKKLNQAKMGSIQVSGKASCDVRGGSKKLMKPGFIKPRYGIRLPVLSLSAIELLGSAPALWGHLI